MSRISISKRLLEELAEGRVKWSRGRRLKLGRWVLKRKIGVFIGSTSEAEGKG